VGAEVLAPCSATVDRRCSASTDPPSSSDNDSGGSVGIIAGAVAGAVFLIVLVSAFHMRRRSRGRERLPTAMVNVMGASATKGCGPTEGTPAGFVANPVVSVSSLYDTVENSAPSRAPLYEDIDDVGRQRPPGGGGWTSGLRQPEVRTAERPYSGLEAHFVYERAPASGQFVLQLRAGAGRQLRQPTTSMYETAA